jgi:hypothetical protein
LRAFGKQITKSTNRDACRDLSGRRIKTVNRDKKIQVRKIKEKFLVYLKILPNFLGIS